MNPYQRRTTPAFTFLSWASFIAALAAMMIGIYTLQEPLSVKGYYAVTALFLTMSSFVLQKVVRDNMEDHDGENKRNIRARLLCGLRFVPDDVLVRLAEDHPR